MISLGGLCVAVLLLARFAAGDAPPPAQVAPPPTVDPQFYDYDSAAPYPVTEAPYPGTAEDKMSGVTITKLTFPSVVSSPYAVNNTVTAYLFVPSGPAPRPAMVVLHEWNPSSPEGIFRLCRAIAAANVTALMIVEPYSLNRHPQAVREGAEAGDAQILSGNVPRMVNALRQAVLDSRRGLDYLSSRPDVDPARLGVAGISLGGVLSGLVAGADPRVKVAITIVGGADFARGFWNGLLTRPYRAQIKRDGYTYQTYSDAMAPVDAANWLPQRRFDPENALMINGHYDLVIRPEQGKALARDFGGTSIVWLNSGHYGALFSAKPAVDLGVRFLRARFFGEAAQFQRPDHLPSRTIKGGLLFGGQEGISPVLAASLINLDGPGRYTVDGMLTLHGVSLAAQARIGLIFGVGVQFPLLHGKIKPRPFVTFTLTL